MEVGGGGGGVGREKLEIGEGDSGLQRAVKRYYFPPGIYLIMGNTHNQKHPNTQRTSQPSLLSYLAALNTSFSML